MCLRPLLHTGNLIEDKSVSRDYSNVFYAESYGTFGELLQGVDDLNRAFLVTCPVNIKSRAIFELRSELNQIVVSNPYKNKAQKLCDLIYESFALQVGGVLHLYTDFEEGKGLGSSSADLVATARAVSKGYNMRLQPSDIAYLMSKIEPSDGVMYPGIVSFFYKEVLLEECFGQIDNVAILGVDEGGFIDTIEYNLVSHPYSEEEKRLFSYLKKEIYQAILQRDIHAIGRVTTKSAELNQKFNYKRHLNDFKEIALEFSLPGIVVAHSGTIIGFLLSMLDPDYEKKHHMLKEVLLMANLQAQTYKLV